MWQILASIYAFEIDQYTSTTNSKLTLTLLHFHYKLSKPPKATFAPLVLPPPPLAPPTPLRKMAAIKANQCLDRLSNLNSVLDNMKGVVDGLLEKGPKEDLREKLEATTRDLAAGPHYIAQLVREVHATRDSPLHFQRVHDIEEDVTAWEEVIAGWKKDISQAISVLCKDTLTRDKVSSQDVEKGRATCLVCMDDLPEADSITRCPKCRHCYHHECVSKWVEEKAMCPHCRTIIKVERHPNIKRSIRLLRRARARRSENV